MTNSNAQAEIVPIDHLWSLPRRRSSLSEQAEVRERSTSREGARLSGENWTGAIGLDDTA